ncbi:MAG TPA: ABC transporter permease [Streptosporangiaceae bacterium]|nr:ABC transporter permease [Streptosporangiaceae bacterium]
MSATAPLAGPAVPRGPAAPRRGPGAARGRALGALALLRATGPVGIASAVIIVIAILMAVFGTLVAPYDPNLPNLSLAWGAPSGGHLLGYDFQGRDVLSRLLVGARTAMLGPLAVVAGSMVAGVLFAVTAAWRRGASDAVISSGLDILFAFPGILLAVLAAAVFGAGLTAASVALAIAYMPYVARVLRGAALKERGQPYVAALEVQGSSATSICLRHIVPNMLPLIVAQATIMFGWAMVDLAAISFLGLGVQPPAPNWGVMISENQPGILQGYPLPALSAGLCIVGVVIAFNVLGERLFQQAQAQQTRLQQPQVPQAQVRQRQAVAR